jgi:hypothetical protein
MTEEKKYNGVTIEFLGSVIRNYRRDYERTYGHPCTLTDVEVAECYGETPVAPTSSEQDEWIVEAMHYKQNLCMCCQERLSSEHHAFVNGMQGWYKPLVCLTCLNRLKGWPTPEGFTCHPYCTLAAKHKGICHNNA